MNKNLEGEHELKSALFSLMDEVNISKKVAVGIIETAFERASNPFLQAVLKRADEVVNYSPEVIAEMASEEGKTVLIIPDGAEIDIEVDDGTVVERIDTSGQEQLEEAELAQENEEVLERVVEGSFRVPKSKDTSSLLSRAVPGYYNK